MFPLAYGMLVFGPKHFKIQKYGFEEHRPDHLPMSTAAENDMYQIMSLTVNEHHTMKN